MGRADTGRSSEMVDTVGVCELEESGLKWVDTVWWRKQGPVQQMYQAYFESAGYNSMFFDALLLRVRCVRWMDASKEKTLLRIYFEQTFAAT